MKRLHLLAGELLIRANQMFRIPLTLGVRLVAVDFADRIFLVRHSYVPGWHLPGGAVDPDETAREAAVREADEEGGLVFDAPPALFHLYFNGSSGRRDHVALFVARNVRIRQAQPRAGLEIREARFFTLDALPETTTDPTRRRIAETLGEAPPSDLW